MSTDLGVTIAAVILGVIVVIRIILRIIGSHMEYKRIQKNMEHFKERYGNENKHRDKRS